MADVNTNQTIKRFEQGGRLIINDGTDNLTIYNHEPGSIEITDPVAKRIEYNDGGSVQIPLESDDQPGMVRFQIRTGSYVTGLLSKLIRRNAAANTAKTLGIVAKLPDYQAATTGQTLTWANGTCWVAEDLQIRFGGPDSMDLVTITLKTQTKYTAATY